MKNQFSGEGKILLIDEEAIIQKALDCILNPFGFSVVYTKNRYKTVELYKKAYRNSCQFNFVFIDFTLSAWKLELN